MARGLVAVTPEILQYERERSGCMRKTGHIYPNGISYGGVGWAPVGSPASAVPVLCFLAGYFTSWHGLDLLLDSIEQSADEFVLHLVGTLTEEQLARVSLDHRIISHGRLDQEQIRLLSNECWLGLGSFALHRKGMQEASTLKVREYLRNGIPVYSGHKDIFPSDFPFYKMGPPDITSIIRFADSVRSIDHSVVSAMSRPYISKELLLMKLYYDLQSSLNE
jgi:hypothetical protein